MVEILRHTLYDFSAATNAGSKITASHAGPMTTIGRTLPPSYLVTTPLERTGAELLTGVSVSASAGWGEEDDECEKSDTWWQMQIKTNKQGVKQKKQVRFGVERAIVISRDRSREKTQRNADQ
jgi:hypothetical protein